jgi:hypothetical protein
VRRAPLLLLLPWLAACAYLNGIYNARETERRADALSRAGQDSEAAALYAIVAQKAETVLTRYPKNRWRTDALYLASRGAALSGDCAGALRRLADLDSGRALTPGRRDRLVLGSGACLARAGRSSEALQLMGAGGRIAPTGRAAACRIAAGHPCRSRRLP